MPATPTAPASTAGGALEPTIKEKERHDWTRDRDLDARRHLPTYIKCG